MRHRDLIRAVARATGETECTIRQRGFTLLELAPPTSDCRPMFDIKHLDGDVAVADPVYSDELLVASSAL